MKEEQGDLGKAEYTLEVVDFMSNLCPQLMLAAMLCPQLTTIKVGAVTVVRKSLCHSM